MFCSSCGSQIANDVASCPVCGAAVKRSGSRMVQASSAVQRHQASSAGGAGSGASQAGTAAFGGSAAQTAQMGTARSEKDVALDYLAGQPQRTGNFVLAEGEVVVRSYRCAMLATGFLGLDRARGYVTVTNQRMMYEGDNSSSRIAMEVPIESVSGIAAYNGVNMNKMLLVLGILLFLIGLMMTMAMNALGILLVGVGVLFMYLSYRKAYQLTIYSSKMTGKAIEIGEGPASISGNQAFYTMKAEPTEEAYKMMYELGALVQDLQRYGDAAIPKWKR